MENQYEHWVDRVVALAYVKYELDEDVVLSFDLETEFLNSRTPGEVVERIAREIFD